MKSRPLPIRLNQETILRLHRVSQLMGLHNVSAVVRLAICRQLPELEAGRLTFPSVTSGTVVGVVTKTTGGLK